jgi:hypothetical protein
MTAMRAAGVALVVALLGSADARGRSERDRLRRDLPGGDLSGRDLSGRDLSARDVAGGDLSRLADRDLTGRDRVGHDRLEPGRGLEMPQELVGRRQAEHLAAAGHTQLAYAAPDDERLRIFMEPRLAGVRAACAAAGLKEPAVETVALDATQASHAVRRWHAQGITAVCAYNDEVALAVLAGCREAGLSVSAVPDLPASPALNSPASDSPTPHAPDLFVSVGSDAPVAVAPDLPGAGDGGAAPGMSVVHSAAPAAGGDVGLSAFAEAVGLATPRRLAVIGVDDIPAARLATPALTTVTTDQAAIAAHLAATVVAAVAGQEAPALPVDDLVRVVVRDSA